MVSGVEEVVDIQLQAQCLRDIEASYSVEDGVARYLEDVRLIRVEGPAVLRTKAKTEGFTLTA